MKLIYMLAGLLAGLVLGGGAAWATGTFDSTTPPTPTPGWMTKPCIANPTDVPKLQNCYWNNTMGLDRLPNSPLTDGGTYDGGFWIRKIPNQPLVCYFYVNRTDSSQSDDVCYSTTPSKTRFDRRVWSANN